MRQFVIAHDLGTTGNKATLYDSEGQLVSSAFFSYNTDYAHPGWAEQDPLDWWQAVRASTHQLLKSGRISKEDIACISFSGQMMGCLPVDANARPLRKAIIWADQRAVLQQQWIEEHISAQDIYHITGHRLSASYSLAKMLWIRDHQPEVYNSTSCFLHAKDYIIARLTGNFVTDVSDASGMNLYDLEKGEWSSRILEATQVNPKQLPRLHQSTDVVGEVTKEAAEELGVAPRTHVVAGGGDGACAGAGAGVIAEGSAYNYIGSSSWIALTTASPIYDPTCRTFTFAHIIPGMFMPTGTMQAAGASYQWLRNQVCTEEYRVARDSGESSYELMNRIANGSPPGANGLLYLPYLMGERSPRWNPNASAAFIGLTIRHTRADMIRAVLEGVSLNLKVILDAFQAQGAKIEVIRLIGGGARGSFWNHILADIYNLPVQRLQILEEATSLGAALAGGVGVGLYSNFSMIEKMNPVSEIIFPDPANRAVYNRSSKLFEAAYETLLPLYERMAQPT